MAQQSITLATLPAEKLGPFPPSGLRETTAYRCKRTGTIVKLCAKFYGSKKYPKDRYVELNGDELDDLEIAQTIPAAQPVRHSLYTEEDMRLPTMRLADLKQLAEYKMIPPDVLSKLRSKDDHIKAILQVRENTKLPTSRAQF